MALAARLRSSLAWLLVLATCVAVFGYAGTVSASDDPPVEGAEDSSPEDPPKDAPEDAAAGGQSEKESISGPALDELLAENKYTKIAVLLLKFIPLGIGVLLLLLWWIKRTRARAVGLPPPVPVEPTLTYAVPGAIGWTVLGMVLLPGLLVILLAVGNAVFSAGGTPEPAPSTAAERGAEESDEAAGEDGSGPAKEEEEPLWIGIIAMALGSLVVAGIVLRRRRWMGRATPAELEALYPVRTPHPSPAPGPLRAFGLGWWGICVSTALVVPVTVVWVLFLDRMGFDIGVQGLVTKVVSPGPAYEPILIAAFGVLVAPLAEETFFRGMLYPAVRRAFGGNQRAVWIAAILVSLIFAGIHRNTMAFVPLFVLAMALTWIMESTNSLAACVLVHATHNAFTLVPLVLLRFS